MNTQSHTWRVWTEWSDLEAPEGVTLLHPAVVELSTADLSDIDFYCPPYLSGPAGLEPIKRMDSLKFLQTPTAGFDDVLPYWREGLTICNARGVHDLSTAELAVALTISSLRGLDDFVRAKETGQWLQGGRRPSLSQQRVALVGFGSVGQAIARVLAALEVSLVAFNRSGRDGAQLIGELDRLLPTFDVVILIIPASPETHHMFDARRLGLMRDGALLVNMARGNVVDTAALTTEIQSGRLRAAVDVTDPEPLPPDHPLWSEPGIIISPHVGGDSSAFAPRMKALLHRQIQRLVDGQQLDNIVVRPNRSQGEEG